MYKVLTTPNESDLTLLSSIKTDGEYVTSESDDQLKQIQRRAELFTAKYIRRSILTETWTLFYDKNEVSSNKFALQGLNVNSITSYVTVADDETETTVDSARYRLSNNEIIFDKPASVGPLDGNPARFYDAVKIVVQAGYGATRDELPQDLQDAIAALVIHWQKNNISSFDDKYDYLPKNFTDAIAPYVNRRSWIG